MSSNSNSGMRGLKGPPVKPPKRRGEKNVSQTPILYTLRTKDDNWMGFTFESINPNDKILITTTYIVAFKHTVHVDKVWTFAHGKTKMELYKLKMEDITNELEIAYSLPVGSFKEAGLPPVMADFDARLQINKTRPPKDAKVDIDIDIIPITSLEYLSMPIEQNVGVILAHTLLEETKRYMFFQCEVINPIRDLDLFRKMLIERR